MDIFFSCIDKRAAPQGCDRGEDNILSGGSRPTRPATELQRRSFHERASPTELRPQQHQRAGEDLARIFNLEMCLDKTREPSWEMSASSPLTQEGRGVSRKLWRTFWEGASTGPNVQDLQWVS